MLQLLGKIIIISEISIAKINGLAPRNISPTAKFCSLRADLIVYTDSPNGGVRRPISTEITDITPNQIRLSSAASATGNAIGRTINMIEIESIKHPNSMINKIYANKKPYGPILSFKKNSTALVASYCALTFF